MKREDVFKKIGRIGDGFYLVYDEDGNKGCVNLYCEARDENGVLLSVEKVNEVKETMLKKMNMVSDHLKSKGMKYVKALKITWDCRTYYGVVTFKA